MILKKSSIKEILSGLYVDDGRVVHRKLKLGEWFNKAENAIVYEEKQKEQNIRDNLSRN